MGKKGKWPLLYEVAPASEGKVTRGPTYRVAYAKDGLESEEHEGVNTLYDLFAKSCKENGDKPALGHRKVVDGEAQPFEYITYAEAAEKVAAVSAGYRSLGLKPKDRVGIYGANCTEWALALQACSRVSLCCVPLYDTLGASAVEHICGHAEVKLPVVAAAALPLFLEVVPRLKGLVAVVYWGTLKDAQKQASKLPVKLISFDELMQMGKEQPHDPIPPSPEDLTTLMYTSGTTGTPKGVMLTHRAVLADIRSLNAYLKHTGLLECIQGAALSYLPLAHIFGRVLEETTLSWGGRIAYWQGDPKKLTDDIQACKPTVFAGVPRIYERIYSGIQGKIAKSGVATRFVYKVAFAWKLAWMKLGFSPSHASPIADALVFKKMKQGLGGRVIAMISGGAPLSRDMQEFFSVAFAVPIVQGYGLTEVCAASNCSLPKVSHWGSVGPPLAGVELRLEAVPDMNADPLKSPPQGEVCLRGDSLFSGYYKEKEKTDEVMDEDGFFHTGDVGEIVQDGSIKIIDRKKNIFKLSQGEYIAVEYLEGVFAEAKIVDQIWVYGNSNESVLVAVVVPDKSELMKWASSNGQQDDFKAVCNSKDGEKFVLEQLDQKGKAAKIKGFERIKAVHLETEPFSVDNDLMTAKMSLKRVSLLKHYKKQIDGMYAALKKGA